MDNRSDIWLGVDAIKPRFVELSDRVWAMPEVCYTEARSSAEHLAELRHQGFRITENVAGIPTALIGEWGEGGPVIAFMGEYDALPGLTPFAMKARARRLALRSSCSQVSVSAPWLTAIASFGLRSAYQRGTSAMGINMGAFPFSGRLGAALVLGVRRYAASRGNSPTGTVMSQGGRGVHIAAVRSS